MRHSPRRKEGRNKRPSAFFAAAPDPAQLARAIGQKLLAAPSVGYALYRRLLALLHARGVLRTIHPGVPSVAVGGMGTDCRGRVLLTSWLLGWAGARGLAAAISVPRREASPPELPFRVLPGADPWECGPEAALLASYVPEGRILVDADPVRGARDAARRFAPDLLVLQDGFVEARLARDLDLAILSPRDLGPDWNRALPAGPWRGDASWLSRASAFCVFAGPQALDAAMAAAGKRLGHFRRPIFAMTFDIWRFRGPNGPVAAEALGEEPYIAVLGESDREMLPELLRHKLGASPRLSFFVHDRHRFTRQDLEHLRADAARLRAAGIVTSPRLALKLRPGEAALRGLPVWTYDPEVAFGPALETDVSFLSWWEAAYAAAAAGHRPGFSWDTAPKQP
jgi:tetraacyldisaccharide 4'-kinase